ncbi:hypothetical protein AYI69_g8015, partial [Smittium culicis]
MSELIGVGMNRPIVDER